MKYYRIIFAFIFTASLFLSCKFEKPLNPKTATITGEISNLEKHKNKKWVEILHPDLFSQDTPFKQIEIDSSGHFRYEMEIVSPALCWGIYNKWFPFVISPGDSLHLSIDANIWDDITANHVIKEKYVEISGTLKGDYNKIIKFEEWASDSIYTRTASQLKNEATKTKSPQEFNSFLRNKEKDVLRQIEIFGKAQSAGSLFYDILNSEINYRTLDDLMRFWWAKPLENSMKIEDISLPENYFSFLENYKMDNNDFFVENRIDFIKELQFFLQFQNSNERKTFIEIYQNKKKTKINDTYFKNQAVYIRSQTKGITRDLCLHFFALYNLGKVPEKSDEIYASVDNLMVDSFVKKHFEENFNSLLKKSTPVPVIEWVGKDKLTAFDSIVNKNRGKVIYVDFWAPWCAPCMSEMKPAKLLRENFKDKKVIFVYLACKCSVESWKSTIANNDIAGINLLLSEDAYSALSRRYEIIGIPHYLLIDKKGGLVNKNAARPSDENIKNEILKLL